MTEQKTGSDVQRSSWIVRSNARSSTDVGFVNVRLRLSQGPRIDTIGLEVRCLRTGSVWTFGQAPRGRGQTRRAALEAECQPGESVAVLHWLSGDSELQADDVLVEHG
jgi:hypothetical protein